MAVPINKTPSSTHFALVLPGAVARGAYEAGVIQELADRDIRIDRIVATSSGALNGLAYAVGIRTGREREMAERLAKAWIEKGGWRNSLALNPLHLLSARGLSNSSGLLKLMRELIEPCRQSQKRDVELRMIITPLSGVRAKIGQAPATSYEHLMRFSNADFDSVERLETVFNVVCAACAFPGLYQPVQLPTLGACVDGGAVNNAPIQYALEESDVGRVIMPVPFPREMSFGEWKSGFGLLNHLISILINERLFRDLKEACTINHDIDKLAQMVSDGHINSDQFEKILSVLGIRKVEVTEIRPQSKLKGGTFTGFFSKRDRISLVQAGREAAQFALTKVE
jgi:predicted acylesterase/phospholipase RssA